MDIQFAKYKELIEQQLEELTAEDVLGQSAQKTVELASNRWEGFRAWTRFNPKPWRKRSRDAEMRINRRCKPQLLILSTDNLCVEQNLRQCRMLERNQFEVSSARHSY